AGGGNDPALGPRHEEHAAARGGRSRRRPRPRGARGVRRADRAREPDDGRLPRAGERAARAGGAGHGAVPAAEGALGLAGRQPLRRRAADAGDRQGARRAAPPARPRRAEHGPGAAARPRDVPRHRADQAHRRDGAPRRAERPAGPAGRRPRLGAGRRRGRGQRDRRGGGPAGLGAARVPGCGMNGTYLLQQLVNGLAIGSLYALLAVGLSMVYGILRLINFAHGELMMVAAMASATFLAGLRVWPPLLLVGGMLLGGVLGVVVERVAYSRLRQASEVNLLVTSLAVSTFLATGARMLWSGQPRRFERVEVLSRLYEVGGVFVRGADIAILAMAVVSMALLTWLTSRTRLGVAMRAVAEDLRVAYPMGIDPSRPILLAFFLGSMLAGAAGVLWGWKFGQVAPTMGFV